MILFILGIFAVIAGIICSASLTSQQRTRWERNKAEAERYNKSFTEPFRKVLFPLYIGVAVMVLLIVLSCVAIVPTGYTGILTTFGAVENRTVSAGINFIAPWQKVVTMDNRAQKVEITTSAFSSDIQQVDIIMSVNYCIDQQTARELYRTVGKNYYESIMYPRIQENTKAIFSQYTAENLISKREILSSSIVDLMREDMQDYGIQIISIAVEDLDFTDAFTSAVEAI